MDISKLKKVEVKSLKINDVEFCIRKWTLKGREKIDEIISNFIKESNQNNYAVGLKNAVIVASVCDDKGVLLLSDKDIDELDSDVANFIYNEAVVFNKLFKNVQENVDNFLATQA